METLGIKQLSSRQWVHPDTLITTKNVLVGMEHGNCLKMYVLYILTIDLQI